MSKTLEGILDWQTSLIIQQGVLQKVSSTKKIHITEEMVSDAKNEATKEIEALIAEARIDPFDFVEPCEPNCSKERHAYHEGQWDMANRIETN